MSFQRYGVGLLYEVRFGRGNNATALDFKGKF